MKKPHILIVEADPATRAQYEKALAALDAPEFAFVTTPDEALAQLHNGQFDLLIADIGKHESNGLDLPRGARARRRAAHHRCHGRAAPGFGYGRHAAGRRRLSGQAAGFASHPAERHRLLGGRRLEAEYELLRRQVERPYRFDDMLGGCAAMRKVFDIIEQVAQSDVDVLVVGETGTGKELVARSIHRRSGRAEGPFVPVDCGAIPESLLESEFFGHEKGAFTGAESRRIGLLEFADRGTFFLDELGELPLVLQAKLLRTLQERKIRRVGGREEIDIDVRIVAATARNLDDMIRQHQFRQDLYYRINVVRIDLPPLRQRGDDIGLLAESMVQRYAREMGRSLNGISPEAYQVLAQYRWPGNVRELQNVIRRGIALAKGPLVELDDLPDDLVAAAGEGRTPDAVGYFDVRDRYLAQFEEQYLRELLARHHGDVRMAASESKLPRGTLYRLMKKYALDSGSFR